MIVHSSLQKMNGCSVKGDMDYELYSILNVGQKATEEEIKESYKRLSLLYHPDKHKWNTEQQEFASKQFHKIHQAYTTLVNHERRSLYDKYGKIALESGLEVGPHLGQAKDIKDRLEHEANLERERLQNRETIRDITTTVEIDATSLVGLDDSSIYAESILPELSCMALSWNLEKWVDPLKSIFSVTTKNQVQHGIGQVSLAASAKLFSEQKSSSSTMMTVGLNSTSSSTIYPSYFMASHQKSLNPWTFLEMSCIIHSNVTKMQKSHNRLSMNPIQKTLSVMTWQIGVSRILSRRSLGHIRWSIGMLPSLALSYKTVLFASGKGEFPIMTSLDSFLQYRLELSRTRLFDGSVSFIVPLSATMDGISKTSIKGKLEAGFTKGIVAKISMNRYITECTSAIMAFSISTLQGIHFKIGIRRNNIKLMFPILLARDNIITWRTLSWTSLFTGIAGYLMEKYVLNPLQEYEELQQLQELESMKEDILFQRKKEAMDMISMMKDIASAKMDSERAIHGLIIIQALYGDLESSNDYATHDVLVPLQLLVFHSQLHLPARSKVHQLGFYDPCFGTLRSRKLSVTYFFREKLHSVIIDDLESLSIPRKEHATT